MTQYLTDHSTLAACLILIFLFLIQKDFKIKLVNLLTSAFHGSILFLILNLFSSKHWFSLH